MSSDLISRSEVIGLIESKCVDGCLGSEDTTLIDAYDLLNEISDLSTAYDVDRVVEQLEKEKNPIYREDGSLMAERRSLDINRAIEIVKAGGANE